METEAQAAQPQGYEHPTPPDGRASSGGPSPKQDVAGLVVALQQIAAIEYPAARDVGHPTEVTALVARARNIARKALPTLSVAPPSQGMKTDVRKVVEAAHLVVAMAFWSKPAVSVDSSRFHGALLGLRDALQSHKGGEAPLAEPSDPR